MSKNILIVTEFFPPVIKGGAAASVFSLAKTLHSTKNNVIVLATQSEDKEIVSDFKIYRTDYHEYYDYSKKGMPVIPSKILVHLFNINSFKNAIEKILDEEKIDVIHTQFIDSTLAALKIKKRHKIPVVVTVRGFWPECFLITKWNPIKGDPCKGCDFSNLYKCIHEDKRGFNLRVFIDTIIVGYFMKWVRKQLVYVDCFLPLSKHVEDALKKRKFNSTCIIPNIFEDSYQNKLSAKVSSNVDKEIKNFMESKGSKKIAIYIGRLRKSKGIESVVRNAKYFNDVLFLIIGDREHIDYFNILQEQIKNDALTNMKFINWVYYTDIRQYYELADFVLLPFIQEDALSRSMLEALYFGKPILASNIGGNPDGVVDGVNGVLFTPGIEGFKEGMKRIINMSFENMSRESRKIFDEKFNKEISTKKYLDIYDKVINRAK